MQKKRSSKNLFGKPRKREIKMCPVFCGTPCIFIWISSPRIFLGVLNVISRIPDVHFILVIISSVLIGITIIASIYVYCMVFRKANRNYTNSTAQPNGDANTKHVKVVDDVDQV